MGNRTELIKSQELRRVIYEFKKRWGVPADLYQVAVGDPDYETGDKGATATKIPIQELVCGGFTFARKFQYSISFLKANSNFSYGGFFEQGDIFAILDAGVEVDQSSYIVIDNLKYNIQSITQLTDKVYMLHLRETTGEAFNQVFDVYVRSTIDVTQDITGSH